MLYWCLHSGSDRGYRVTSPGLYHLTMKAKRAAKSGIEPLTNGLTVRCTTSVLHGNRNRPRSSQSGWTFASTSKHRQFLGSGIRVIREKEFTLLKWVAVVMPRPIFQFLVYLGNRCRQWNQVLSHHILPNPQLSTLPL